MNPTPEQALDTLYYQAVRKLAADADTHDQLQKLYMIVKQALPKNEKDEE